jgi:hypothetical protein
VASKEIAMTATELKRFETRNCSLWTYRTLLHFGTCIVDGQTIKMRFTLKIDVPEAVPDVLQIEEFCREMSQEKATLEGYTAKLVAFVGCEVTGKGKTKTHGVITCRASTPTTFPHSVSTRS